MSNIHECQNKSCNHKMVVTTNRTDNLPDSCPICGEIMVLRQETFEELIDMNSDNGLTDSQKEDLEQLGINPSNRLSNYYDKKLLKRFKGEDIFRSGKSPKQEDHREYNVGSSDYSKHNIQPWDIWKEYPDLNPFDADIIKRVLRDKDGDCRTLDYEKIIHICQERLSHFKKEDGVYVDTVYKG